MYMDFGSIKHGMLFFNKYHVDDHKEEDYIKARDVFSN